MIIKQKYCCTTKKQQYRNNNMYDDDNGGEEKKKRSEKIATSKFLLAFLSQPYFPIVSCTSLVHLTYIYINPWRSVEIVCVIIVHLDTMFSDSIHLLFHW